MTHGLRQLVSKYGNKYELNFRQPSFKYSKYKLADYFRVPQLFDQPHSVPPVYRQFQEGVSGIVQVWRFTPLHPPYTHSGHAQPETGGGCDTHTCRGGARNALTPSKKITAPPPNVLTYQHPMGTP